MRLLIDQISMQQEQIVALEGVNFHNLIFYTFFFSVDWVKFDIVFHGIQPIHYDLVTISEGKKRKDQECAQLKTLVNDLESTFLS